MPLTSTDASFQEKLDRQLLASFVKQTPTVITGHLLVASINIGLFWQQISHAFITAWMMFLLAIGLVRWLMTRQYQQQQQSLAPARWRSIFATSSLSLGLAWCVWCIYVSTTIQYAGTGLSIVVVTSAGLVAGAVASTSSSLLSYICFSAPILLPFSGLLLLNDQSETWGIGLLMVLFFIITWNQVRRINGVLKESIINSLNLEASQKQAEKLANELHQLSTQDALTGVTNRRGFDETLSREWLRARRAGTPLTLLMIDADFFKPYNDTLGHLAGDDCLRRIAASLTGYARREGEVVACYGGEEFAVLLPGTTGPEGVTIAEAIAKDIADLDIPHPASGVAKRITVSIGVHSVVPGELEDSQTLVSHADRALYQAKADGRNCIRLAA
ncbi:GGDEF domain-containing protein [Allohahella marinimesophila]|uniref:diguanylate cyclase n=1 Tax=Allohahella marinimesophila TaxID=1054972 RepID=A0ABP7NXB4_9GAMM